MKSKDFTCQLGEYFDVFLLNIKHAKPNTISSYADSFAIFFEFIYEQKNKEHTNLVYKDFTPQLFDEYILWLRNTRGYADSSIHPRFSALVSFLKYASRRNMSALHAYSAAVGSETPKATRTEFPYFSLDEMKILLKLPNPDKYLGDRDLVLLSFLYETAARAQEACNVCVKDIRFGTPTKAKLTGKGGKVREVPVATDVADLLRYHLKTHDLNSPEHKIEPLFSSQTNKKMTTACVRSIVAKYVKQAKAENPNLFQEKNYSPHSFRHSKAVHMAESGTSIIYIRNFLGHAFISSTEIYARVGQAAVTKALTERKIPTLSATPPKKSKTQCPLPSFIEDKR
jgi:site-specific recombinase XerD